MMLHLNLTLGRALDFSMKFVGLKQRNRSRMCALSNENQVISRLLELLVQGKGIKATES